jgi:hypothetical protein
MLHAAALTGAVLAASSGFAISVTAPVICRDYQVGKSLATRCNDGHPLSPPVNGIPLGPEYIRATVQSTPAPRGCQVRRQDEYERESGASAHERCDETRPMSLHLGRGHRGILTSLQEVQP